MVIRIFSSLLIILFWSVSGWASVDINGVNFAERRVINDTELRLTGTAVLTWAVLFDVYVGAFYLPERTAGSEWTENVPKLLELSYLRKIEAKDFSDSSDKLLQETLPPGQYQELAERLKSFYSLFRDVRPGDRYSLAYHPELGTELRLNGEPLGSVSGHDFALAYFGLWLGPQPISTSFRDRLLGG
jgi:hypothetical protein